jgi:hypothetical protein
MNLNINSLQSIREYTLKRAEKLLPKHHTGVCQRCGKRTMYKFLVMANDYKDYCGKCAKIVNLRLDKI